MRNENQHPQWYNHHQPGRMRPRQAVNPPRRVQEQPPRVMNLPPPVMVQEHPPANPGGWRPIGVQNIRMNQYMNNGVAGAGTGPAYANQQPNIRLPNGRNWNHQGNVRVQIPQMRNPEENQFGRRRLLTVPREVRIPPTHMMSGYGRVPLNFQHQPHPPLSYPAAHQRTERKYDPEMTLEEALTGDWYPGNNDHQAVGNNLANNNQGNPAMRTGGVIGQLGSTPVINPGTDR